MGFPTTLSKDDLEAYGLVRILHCLNARPITFIHVPLFITLTMYTLPHSSTTHTNNLLCCVCVVYDICMRFCAHFMFLYVSREYTKQQPTESNKSFDWIWSSRDYTYHFTHDS